MTRETAQRKLREAFGPNVRVEKRSGAGRAYPGAWGFVAVIELGRGSTPGELVRNSWRAWSKGLAAASIESAIPDPVMKTKRGGRS